MTTQSEGKMFRATLWEEDGKAFEYTVRISPMADEPTFSQGEQTARWVDKSSEGLPWVENPCRPPEAEENAIADAYERGRREGLEEAAKIADELFRTTFSSFRIRDMRYADVDIEDGGPCSLYEGESVSAAIRSRLEPKP